MSYIKRRIDVTFQLGLGDQGKDGSEDVALSGLRARVHVEVNGQPSMNRLDMRIYGMSLDRMNQFSRAGMLPTAVRKNSVIVKAGDFDSGMSIVYIGTLGYAATDAQGSPDVSFNVSAWDPLYEAMKPLDPNSYPGSADVATIMSGLATAMNKRFEPNGVQLKLSNPYLYGTAYSQFIQLADAAAQWMDCGIDNKGILWIVNKGQPRLSDQGSSGVSGQVPLISPATGMVGYANSNTPGNIFLRTIYNPSISHGGSIQVESELLPIKGLWRVEKLSHTLESETPNGAWFTDIHAQIYSRPGILNG